MGGSDRGSSVGGSGEGSDSGGGVGNVSNNGTRGSGIDTTEKTSTYSVGSSIWVRKDSGESSDGGSLLLISITSLPLSSLLRGSGGGSGSSIISSSEFSLSSSNLSGIFNSDGKGKVENGSGKGFDSGGGTGDGKVGSGNSESVDGVGDVVDSLEETVGVNVLVGAGGHSVGIAGLSTG
jgi:hypothetical protein